MSNQTIGLNDRLYDYLLSATLREAEVLADLRRETMAHPQARMQISPEQGQFMALLVQLMGAKKTLEVGVFTGYSALVVAMALPDDGKVVLHVLQMVFHLLFLVCTENRVLHQTFLH